jgi:hypothetical protein
MIHKLHKEMTNLVRRWLGRFLPAHLIADVPLKDISFKDTSLQLENDDLCLGEEAQMFLEDNIDELSSSVPELLK